MKNPVISVIMPAYNASTYIAESIESVVSQTYTNWELLIVDDGSTDNTSEVVKNFLTNESRIKYIHQENGKQAKARNRGIRESRGELVAFLDSDDLWTPNRLAKGVESFLKNENVDLVFSQGYRLAPIGKTDYNAPTRDIWDMLDIPSFIKGNKICLSSVTVKQSVILEVGGFNEEPLLQNAEDYELWLRLLFSGFRFTSIPDRLYMYRIHDNQNTFDGSSVNIPNFAVYESLYKRFPNHHFSKDLIHRLCYFLSYDSFHDRVESFFFNLIREKGLINSRLIPLIGALPRRLENRLIKRIVMR